MTSSVSHKFQKIRVCKALKVTLPGDDYATSGFIFWGLWFLNFSTRTVFAPLLPLIEDNLSLSHGQAGGLFASLSIGYTASLLIAGRFASMWGYKGTVVSGFLGLSVVLFYLQRAESYIAFHAIFLLIGLALGSYLPSISAGIFAILPFYLIKERGIDFDYANSLIGISRAGGMVVTIIIGFFVDRFGYRRMLRISILTTGLSTIGFSLVSTLPLILIGLIVQAILSTIFFAVGFAAISKLTALSERSMATGLVISMGTIFGSGKTPLLLGMTADYYSFQVGILGVGIVTTLSSLLVGLLKETEEAQT